MFGLDSVLGGGLGTMVPGANLLQIVSKGLEAIKDLIEQGNTKGADAILGFLNDVLAEGAQKEGAAAAEPQPFSEPQQQGAAGQPLNLQFSFAPPSGQPVSFGKLPEVDGSPAGDRALSNAASSRVTGSEGNKERALKPGSDEWTTVMWAMQSNEKVQYDADQQRFFTTLSDGSKLDLCSVYDVQDVVGKGGLDRNNGNSFGLVKDFMQNKLDEAWRRPMTATLTLNLMAAHPPSEGNDDSASMDSLNSQIDDLKRRLQDLEAARQVMASSSNITMTVGM
jgi:hypothetical protein